VHPHRGFWANAPDLHEKGGFGSGGSGGMGDFAECDERPVRILDSLIPDEVQ
jgi:hypothetical protein